MTTASLAVIPAATYVPNTVEAELRLLTLSGSDNPLAAGGKLQRTLSGASATWAITSGSTELSNESTLPTALPSTMTFVLEAPTGKRLLELSLEIADYTSDWDHERVEIRVTSKGASALIAQSLSIDAGSYSWHLSAKAIEVGDTLELLFELVQEKVATNFLDAQASTRLAFVAPNAGGGTQQAVIRPKRHKETLVPT
jgi:hypothetical protein